MLLYISSEQEILKEEITSLQVMRDKLKQRVSDLESDLKKTTQELEKVKEKQASGQDGEEARNSNFCINLIFLSQLSSVIIR